MFFVPLAIQTVEADDGTALDIEAYAKKLIGYADASSAIDKARKILDSIDFEAGSKDVHVKRKFIA